MNYRDDLTAAHRITTRGKEAMTMLVPEEHLRARAAELARESANARAARAARAGRGWEALARYARHRAECARRRAQP